MEAQSSGVLLVGLTDLRTNSILTEAFHRPGIIAGSADFMTSNQRYIANPGANPDEPIRALVVGWVTRKECIVYFIGGIILLSMTAGVLVGYLARSASLGVSVCGGLLAVLSCIEGLICWRFRYEGKWGMSP